MATKAPSEMNGEEALEAYGFAKSADGLYYKETSDTQTWQQVPGGWRRIERGGPGLVAGAPPWGRPYKDTGLIEVPYRNTEKYANVSGLHPATHPETFEWVWPDAKVAEIYAHGHTVDYGSAWKRNEAGEIVADRSPAAKADA